MQNGSKKLAIEDVRKRIYHYCAYQERSHQEVKHKLYDLGLYSEEAEELITLLIQEGYLNEERFAKAFAGGKFRLKSWGKIKIVQALEGKGLTKNCINSGLKEIADADYIKTIELLIDKKLEHVTEENPFIKRDKLAGYVIQKGFEPELVWEIVKRKVS